MVWGDLGDEVPGVPKIPEIRAEQVEVFLSKYWDQKPVIIRGGTLGNNARFRELVSKESLLRNYGNVSVTLSTANTNSYDKVPMALEHYIRDLMGPQPIERSGIDTLYHFGDNDAGMSRSLLSQYELPRRYMSRVERHSLSFGLSGTGTGVPFHTHGPVFAEVFYGRKRWFVSGPEHRPEFNGTQTTLFWYRNTLRAMSAKDRSVIYDGICARGDLLYLPDRWYHSTLNLGQTVFMSVSKQKRKIARRSLLWLSLQQPQNRKGKRTRLK